MDCVAPDRRVPSTGMCPNSSDHQAPAAAESRNDVDQTRKDRSYSPSSEAETETLQAADTGGSDTPDGVQQLPGTGGPDDGGDVSIPDDHIDAATIVERARVEDDPQDATAGDEERR
jgi:hypothetical protein